MIPEVTGRIAEQHIADLRREAEAYRRRASARRTRGWSWSRLRVRGARRAAPATTPASVPVPASLSGPASAGTPALRVIAGGSTSTGPC